MTKYVCRRCLHEFVKAVSVMLSFLSALFQDAENWQDGDWFTDGEHSRTVYLIRAKRTERAAWTPW